MSRESRLETLRLKHQELSDFIEKFERRPAADSAEVMAMKREKLRLKEEITRFSQA